jgi:hypothetical protein
MKFSEETNAILDKLAEIAGTAGGEILPKYTEHIYYTGLFWVIGSCVMILAGVAGLGLCFKVAPSVKDDGGEIAVATLGIMGLIAVNAGVVIYGSYFGDVFAPEGAAIKQLISQLGSL